VAAPPENELRLHLNENPYGCSLLVQESLSIHDAFGQRPGPLSRTLQGALARYTGRSPVETHLADGLDDLLRRVLRVTAHRDGPLLAYAPYPSSLAEAARCVGVDIEPVPRGEHFKVEARGALELAGGAPGAVYIGSPNDPTGDVAPPLEVAALLRSNLTVIVDETYAEFTDKQVGVLGREFPNLVSVRSFAPWAGLWGLPVSYALGSPELVAELDRCWPEVTLSSPARIAAGASLDDQALLKGRVRRLRLERARLYRQLRKLNFVQPLPSHGPFLLCRVTRGDPDRVCALLEAEGVLVHNCDEEGLSGYLRVSVGTPEQTDQLMATMCRVSVDV
jgi:histidinol-phosphate aminotransferase